MKPEVINNCKNSVGILSDETIVKMHPWVTDPEQELQRIKDEKEEAMADPYQAAFYGKPAERRGRLRQPVTGQDGGDGNARNNLQRNADYWAQRMKNMEDALLDQSYSLCGKPGCPIPGR